MSAWQCRIKVLPVAGLVAVHGTIPDAIRVVRYTSSQSVAELEEPVSQQPNYWSRVTNTDDIVDAFARLLPEVSSWGSNARMFGEEGDDFIEIWRNDENSLARITIAFSLRQLNRPFIRGILETTRALKCVLHDIQSMQVCEPTIEDFVARARACTAARFLPHESALEELLKIP